MGFRQSDVAEKEDVRTQGCWQELGRKCDQKVPSQVERDQTVHSLEVLCVLKEWRQREKAGEWCRSQDRAVPGCGHRSGWQKRPDRDDQMSGGQPIRKTTEKGL